MDLKELGSRLKAERQRQGLTIEQIMEITKISRININALEDGNQKEFPHQVYAKGFIKNYAKALGLDAEEIGEEFSKIISTDADVEDIYQPDEPILHEYSETKKNGSLGTVLIILILLAVLGGLVYYLHDNSMLGFGQKDDVEITVSEELVEESPAGVELEVVPSDKPIDNEVQTSGEDQTESMVETSIVQEKPTDIDVVETEQIAPVQEVAPVVSLKNVVVISAKPGEACWLEAITDGNSKEYVIQEGDALKFLYTDNLKIKLGNAGGVNVVSDGKPLEFTALKGKVKTLEFPVAQ